MRRVVLLWLLAALVGCSGAPPSDATGEEIYLQLCASCHARDLSGGIGPALGPGSAAAELGDEMLVRSISEGRGSRMPAFGGTLDESQISRLVDFLRERQGG
ncbi:MAG: cytochrome c [Acidimicrobiia bacterium]|nr:cytochrome c [Acidimicrobiia bacterium]